MFPYPVRICHEWWTYGWQSSRRECLVLEERQHCTCCDRPRTRRQRRTTVPVQDGSGMENCSADCTCAHCWIVPLTQLRSIASQFSLLDSVDADYVRPKKHSRRVRLHFMSRLSLQFKSPAWTNQRTRVSLLRTCSSINPCSAVLIIVGTVL